MKRVHRCYLTLLEMLIAMALTVIILLSLSMFYQSASRSGFELDRLKTENFSLRYLENRLMRVLPTILPAKSPEFLFLSIEKDALTAENSQNLLFTFNNDDVLDKPFSNEVIGRLYVDKDQDLMLAYWPVPKRLSDGGGHIPIKKEVLMNQVEALHFEFYVAPQEEQEPEKGEANKSAEQNQPFPQSEFKEGWHREEWRQEYESLPALVKISIKRSNKTEPLTYIIPLPNTLDRIIYHP